MAKKRRQSVSQSPDDLLIPRAVRGIELAPWNSIKLPLQLIVHTHSFLGLVNLLQPAVIVITLSCPVSRALCNISTWRLFLLITLQYHYGEPVL